MSVDLLVDIGSNSIMVKELVPQEDINSKKKKKYILGLNAAYCICIRVSSCATLD